MEWCGGGPGKSQKSQFQDLGLEKAKKPISGLGGGLASSCANSLLLPSRTCNFLREPWPRSLVYRNSVAHLLARPPAPSLSHPPMISFFLPQPRDDNAGTCNFCTPPIARPTPPPPLGSRQALCQVLRQSSERCLCVCCLHQLQTFSHASPQQPPSRQPPAPASPSPLSPKRLLLLSSGVSPCRWG